jgi:RimJ/RimL family protein N-acetyltransferase
MDEGVSLKRWQTLSEAEQSAVLDLHVTEQQVEFAGTVAQSVQACVEDPADEITGLAVIHEHRVVGFFLLKRGSSAPVWGGPKAAVVSAMRIDVSQQGKGMGSAALQLLPPWITEHWPDSTELALSVDEENHSARRAYARAGFMDLGKREQGRIGWVRYMSMPICFAA